ncbi:MAG: FkbM family methyltransferase [Candidatus Woesearchaeota archaeon]
MQFVIKCKKIFRSLLRNHQTIHHNLRRIYYLPRYWLPARTSIMNILEEYSVNNSEIYFIQIGANNGVDRFTDFRKRFKWRSILVEPQKEVFSQLKENNNYSSDIIFENMAISNSTEIRKLYKFSLSHSAWATGIASFNKEHIIKHIKEGWFEEQAKLEGINIPENPDDYIISEEVACITFEDLIKKHRFKKIDILVLDTEGYDFEILKSIDFNNFKPKIIIFEFVHLKKNDFIECRRILRQNGYKLFIEDLDILALH